VRRWIAAGCVVALAVFAAGYMVGKRGQQPAKVIVTESTKAHDEWKKRAETAELTIANFQSTDRSTIVTRWRTLPSGEKIVEQSKEKEKTVKTEDKTEKKAAVAESVIASRSVETTRITIWPPKQPWSVSLMGGVDLSLKRHYGLMATRAIGPVTAGLWALPSAKAGGVSVGFRF
jgi:hypothetical protein